MYDQSEHDLLRMLADRVGIVAEYYDIAGTQHVTTDETRRVILSAMQLRAGTREELIEELTAWDTRAWLRGCEPFYAVWSGHDAGTWSCHVPCEASDDAALQVRWSLLSESGESLCERTEGPELRIDETRTIDGRRFVRITVAFPQDLPLGYYTANVSARGGTTEREVTFRLIVAPERCYIPAQLAHGARWWGLALQLYSLRSDRNWGIGDFGDLKTVVEWTGRQLGAAVIGLNPLHALKNTKPYHISPYSPSSRLFLNDLYIDIEQVAEYHTASEVKARLTDPSFRARLEAARQDTLVDYDTVRSIKREILELCYQAFSRDHFKGGEPDVRPTTERGWSFHRFTEREGDALTSYALFQALEESRQIEQGASATWVDWPESYRVPTSAAVREFRRAHSLRVGFFQYLQWLAAEQLLSLAKTTRGVGMPIGFYHDLALGSDRHGADGWRFQDVLALNADCGAPPDAFAPDGQNWGFPPFDPLRLRASGYQSMIELLRKNLRYGGAIRLDHVMALFRLFWIPRGHPASMGTYVHYRDDELLAILALESMRAEALVIGEDLGTVPDWVRERLESRGVLSYRVLYFERTEAGAWKPPAQYPAQALAVVTTHDLATLSGYWEGADIEARSLLGLFPSEQTRTAMLSGRQWEKAGILAALKSEGLLPPGVSDDPAQVPSMTSELTEAVHQYLARSPAWIVLATIEDLIGARAQANLPGTLDQYPNWCRKLGPTVEEMTHDSRFERLATQLGMLRPSV